jgi:hypothetical protein
MFVYITLIGGWAYGRLDGQDQQAAKDRDAQCEGLQVLIDRQAANLDPEIVKSLFAPLRAADPQKFDAAIERARADLARLKRVQARQSCAPPQRHKNEK